MEDDALLGHAPQPQAEEEEEEDKGARPVVDVVELAVEFRLDEGHERDLGQCNGACNSAEGACA